jgi:hypothetical protein
MRLDCDEAIASARSLFELYRDRGLPLSVAIKTGQAVGPADTALLVDILAAGGTILSHSVNHWPNWGGSAEIAKAEARQSKSTLERLVPGLAVRHAVSPFHQNPSFVPQALAEAGYRGLVTGTIRNDPEYLMARGGEVPHGPRGFVSHSQSCMLHGDCMGTEDGLRVYKDAFRVAKAGGQFFGYLDHPFSERYAYGWTSEAERRRAHTDFLDFMTADCDRTGDPLLFVSEGDCLDFMLGKAATEIIFDDRCDTYAVSQTTAAGRPLSLGYRGRVTAATAG